MLDTSKLFDAIGGEHDDKENVVDRLRFDDALNVPIELTDADLWANYINEDLYEMDKKIREFLKKTRYTRQKKGIYRTTASLVFSGIFGRQPTPEDSPVCRMVNEILKYYCTSYTGQTTFHGKPVTRVYRFSRFSANSKRPYSLRLRLEEAKGNGGSVFRKGPGSDVDKRTHGRRADREDG